MNPSIRPLLFAFTVTAACLASTSAWADPAMDRAILGIQHQWAQVMYEVPESEQAAAFAKLDAAAKDVAERYPGQAEPLIWEAISLSTHAKVAGGLSGLRMAKEARDLLDKAEQINPKALDGSVYSSLGGLYAKVPGWPIGFGDKAKADAYFKKALALNPNGIDPNYLYGDFLFDQQRYKEAEQVLERALHAPSRPNRPLADQGRRREVQALLTQVHEKLGVTRTAQVTGAIAQ
jgi:tetratricopeptide (TPR) repeat protein